MSDNIKSVEEMHTAVLKVHKVAAGQPQAGWTETNVDEVRKALNDENPNIIFDSALCKGFSIPLTKQ